MNNVNNRKMFAKRDARNKLAEMGGILASSPELLGEAQKFANGGSPYTSQYDSYLSQYQPDGNAPFGTSDRRLMESPQQYNMNRPLPTDAEIQYANTMAQQDSRRSIMDKILQRPATFSPSEGGEEENENIVRAQLIERFGDRVADNILNQAKQLRAKAKILGQGVNVLTSYIPEAVGIVQSVAGFSEAGAQRLEGAGELRQDALDKMESSSYDLLDLQRTKNLSPEDRLRKLNAQKETASQVEYEAGLPALREKLSALEGNDPMGMLSDTFIGRVQPPEGGYDAEQISSSPGQAEAIFGTGAGARFAGSGFTDFEQLAKDNPEMMAANFGMLQDQDQMTNQGIVNSLDPESRAALSAQQDLTREEFLNRMPEPSGNVTPLSKDLQLMPSEQALAEASDYNTARDIGQANETTARDIGAANEAAAMFNQPGGINSQGPNPEVTPGYVFDRELFEANASKNEENQTAIDNATESLLRANTKEEKDTMREEYLNRVPDDLEVDENTFINKLDGWLTSFDDAVFGRNKAAKVAEVVGEVITPDGSGLKGNTKEELKALALADSNEEIIIDNNKKASSNGNVVTTPIAEDNILSSVEQGNAALDLALGGTGEVSTSTTLTQKNKEMQKLYQEMFGEDEKEVAAAKWNQLAMVGFAIAAGKDPNALTNIAAGLLSGAKQKRQDVATRKARRDKIKMSAFDAALSGSAADKKFGRDLTIAKMRLDATGGYSKDQNPNRTFYQLLQTNIDAYQKTYTDMPPKDANDKALTGEALTDFIRKKATEDALSTVQLRTPTFSLENYVPPDDDLSIPTISTREEFDALPSGAVFNSMFEGKLVKQTKP